MAMAYMAAGFCFLLTFLNLISVGLAGTQARPRPAPLPPLRRSLATAPWRKARFASDFATAGNYTTTGDTTGG